MASKKSPLSTQRPNYSTRSTEDVVVPSRHYHAYLLRIWREEESMPWRVQLENPHTNEVLGFATLAKLMAFLDERFTTQEEIKK